jgi:hypothetical protein
MVIVWLPITSQSKCAFNHPSVTTSWCSSALLRHLFLSFQPEINQSELSGWPSWNWWTRTALPCRMGGMIWWCIRWGQQNEVAGKVFLPLYLVFKALFRSTSANIRNLKSCICFPYNQTPRELRSCLLQGFPFLSGVSHITVESLKSICHSCGGCAMALSSKGVASSLCSASSCVAQAVPGWAWSECDSYGRMWFSYHHKPDAVSVLSGLASFPGSLVPIFPF